MSSKSPPPEAGRARLLNVGFGNFVVAGRVVAIVSPSSSPMRRLREDARQEGRLIDATQGRRTRSIIVTDSNHLILSAIQAETVGQRFLQTSAPGKAIAAPGVPDRAEAFDDGPDGSPDDDYLDEDHEDQEADDI